MVREMPGAGRIDRRAPSSSSRSARRRRDARSHVAREQDWHFQAYQNDELLCEQDRPEARLVLAHQRRAVPPRPGPRAAARARHHQGRLRHRGPRRGGSRHRADDPRARRRVRGSPGRTPSSSRSSIPHVSKAVGVRDRVRASRLHARRRASPSVTRPTTSRCSTAAGYAVAIATSRPEVHRRGRCHVRATGGRRRRRRARGARAGLT